MTGRERRGLNEGFVYFSGRNACGSMGASLCVSDRMLVGARVQHMGYIYGFMGLHEVQTRFLCVWPCVVKKSFAAWQLMRELCAQKAIVTIRVLLSLFPKKQANGPGELGALRHGTRS